MHAERRNAIAGLLLCAGFMAGTHPAPLFIEWPQFLVLTGAAVAVPAGMQLCQHHPAWKHLEWRIAGQLTRWHLPAVLALMLQMLFPAWGGLLALPWLAFTVAMALQGLILWNSAAGFPGLRIALTGWIQLAAGGAWAAADALQLQPLGFDGLIVRLTAAHFHFAGFCLPVMAGLSIQAGSGCWTRATGTGAALGVMLVAAGITTTKLTDNVIVESILASAYALVVLAFSVCQCHLAVRLRSVLLGISSVALFTGMLLALAYALRPFLPLPWLHIPRMWALHGSLQALGFVGIGFLAWMRIAGETGAGQKLPRSG